MTTKPRRRLAQTSLVAAATLAFVFLACDVPLPLDNEESGTPSLARAASDESAPEEVTLVVHQDQGEPVLYIDGVRIHQSVELVLDTLSNDRIDRVEVVKGNAARAQFGESAASGVIHIYLKTAIEGREKDSPEG